MKRYKKALDFSYAIGAYPTLELLTSHPEQVTKLLIHSLGTKNSGVQKIKAICEERKIQIEIADTQIANISQSNNCYAIGVFKKYQSTLTYDNHLVLVNPEDTGNLGTIIRTMLAFNLKNLAIISPAIDIFHPKTLRASMGGVFKINFEYFPSFKEYREKFPDNNCYPFMTNSENTLSETKFTKPFALIFGSESGGLSNDFLKIGQSVKIEQAKEVDSLNLATAVAISLYQATYSFSSLSHKI